MKIRKVKTDSTAKYIAGDFVNQAKPRAKPSNKDKSSRGYLANNNENNKEIAPKAESMVSGTANRSKKKVKGKKIYSNELMMATVGLKNKRQVR